MLLMQATKEQHCGMVKVMNAMRYIKTTAKRLDLNRAREQGRGRDALNPTDIPAKGWKDIVWRVYGCVEEERLGLIAAGVAFYVILGLFPALTALVSVYGLLTDPRSIAEQVIALYGVLPDDVIALIRDQLNTLTNAPRGQLGLGFVVSLSLALWTVNTAMMSVFDGLNVTYREREKRSFVRLNLVSLAFAMGAVVMAMLYMTAIAVVPLVLSYIGIGSFADMLIRVLRWPIIMAMSAVAIALLARYGPSREHARWAWITPGSVFVMLAWVVMSIGFSVYLSNFAHYDKTYGTLGAVIGVMVWVWLSTYILLVGSAINAEMEHQTAKDTTTKPNRPLGKRGAVMADTVGKARKRR